MEDDHVGLEKKESKNVHSIFTLFSDLTGEKNDNPKHCLTLVKSLRGDAFNVGSGTNLQYSVKRLVRGLGSSRLYSQCGCFAALTCCLKYQACLVRTVLEALERELEPARGVTKSEMRALRIGCVFTCGAIIHSGLFNSQSKEIQEDVLRKLIDAGMKKSYLLVVVCQFLVDVINSADDKQFKSIVWPVCKCELLQNLVDCGPDIFYVFLTCMEKNGKVADKFLQGNAISRESLMENIVKCLFNSSVKSDHPVYNGLGQFFCANATEFVKFWPKYVNENAKINSHKDAVLITVFSYIIKNLQEATIVPQLLVPKLLEAIIKVLSLKRTKSTKEDCSSIAKCTLNSMISLLSADDTSEKVRLEAIRKLLFYPCNLKFEIKTRTKCIYALALKLSCEFTKKLVDIYKQVVSGEIMKTIDEDGTEENWNSKEKQHALHMLTKTLNLPSLKKEIYWKLDEIKFIFEIGFLKKFQVPSEIQKCGRDCFYKAIMVQMPSLNDHILFLDELAVHVNENIKNKELEVSDEVEDLWDKMLSVVRSLKKKSNNKIYAAVHILLIYMGLHLFTDWELAKGGIEELLACYQNLRETQKKKSGDESAPHWTEVTVDLILSLLSRDNRLWRHVVSCVFPQMVSQITPTALEQIIDALDPSSRNDVLRHVNSDDSEDESEEGEEGSESSSTGDEESELEEADHEGRPNDQLRLAVREALGYSAGQTDDESVDMDDMNEEEERRLNESLSEAFRQFRSKSQAKKKKQTKEEEALTHFRLRVLDLVEIYVTNSPSMGGCLDLLPPLFDLLELSIRDHRQRPLQSRVDSIIKQVSAVKTFSNTDNVTQAILKDAFRSAIGRKETSALVFVEMSPRISDCAAFLVCCSQKIPNEGADIPLVDEYESLLQGFFHSRDFKLSISMFQAVLKTPWKGNYKIAKTLYELLASPDVRIFKKNKVIELLRLFYKNHNLHGSCDETSKSDLNEIETNFVKNFNNLLAKYKKAELKSSEKMYLSFFSNVIVLIIAIRACSRRYGVGNRSLPPWRDLVTKMAEVESITNNKKTRSQLGNLAKVFDVELPPSERAKRKRKFSETSNQGKDEEESEEKERKKKRKNLSAETRKLKKESRKLREQISSDGLAVVRFSAFDSLTLPEPEGAGEGEEEQEEEDELKSPKKKKQKKRSNGVLNGTATD